MRRVLRQTNERRQEELLCHWTCLIKRSSLLKNLLVPWKSDQIHAQYVPHSRDSSNFFNRRRSILTQIAAHLIVKIPAHTIPKFTHDEANNVSLIINTV